MYNTELYEISVRFFNFTQDEDIITTRKVIGMDNALHVAEMFTEALNSKQVLVIDAMTGEIIKEF